MNQKKKNYSLGLNRILPKFGQEIQIEFEIFYNLFHYWTKEALKKNSEASFGSRSDQKY